MTAFAWLGSPTPTLHHELPVISILMTARFTEEEHGAIGLQATFATGKVFTGIDAHAITTWV